MTSCLQCNKELTHIEGRKKKHFCDNNCKNKHFYAERQKLIKAALAAKPNGKHIQIEDLEEVIIEEVTPNPPTTLDELKALCPFEKGTDEFRLWVQTERQKYGI